MTDPDFTPGVSAGLSWAFLLAAALNAGAAAYVAYLEMVSEGASREGLAPRTRRLPGWLAVTVLGAYGVAALILPGGVFWSNAYPMAYSLCALANLVVAVASAADAAHFAERNGRSSTDGPSSLDDHVPAVGLGPPLNRTLWALVWAVVSTLFQALGIAYAFGAEVQLPRTVRDGIDQVCSPGTLFVGASLGLAATFRYRQTLVKGPVIWGLVNLVLLGFGLSLTDAEFRAVVTAPDHLPLVALSVLLVAVSIDALRRAVINDARGALGLPKLERQRPESSQAPSLGGTAAVAGMAALLVWSLAIEAPLEGPADPTMARNPSLAPWFLLAFQEYLVYFDPWFAGILLPALTVLGLLLIPFLDIPPAGHVIETGRRRSFGPMLFAFGVLVLWLLPTLQRAFLRGPNETFFGPFEVRNVSRGFAEHTMNLSDLFWVRMIGTSRPKTILARESPGWVVLVCYITLLPWLLRRVVFRPYVARAGRLRYATLSLFLLVMAALPAKMMLRWVFHLKDLIAIPEYGFNL